MLAALLFAGLSGLTPGQSVDPNVLAGLRYRLVGPFRGGRVLAVTGVPGDDEKFYFGAVGGGVWETENAGRTWKPIFDGMPVASIGAIAVAPSDPSVIYVGTGEADMRSDIQQGDGMYKSVDGGKSWSHIGLADSRQIGRILVDPKDPNTAYVAALGHQYAPNEERGVFKTVDGGRTWSKILYRGPDTGAIDLAMDPADSRVLFACLWSTRRPPWSVYPPSNGPGSGVFKSSDSGKTWSQIVAKGFPSQVGRVGLAISPSDGRRIYAIVDSPDPDTNGTGGGRSVLSSGKAPVGGFYRSDNGGTTWVLVDSDQRLWGRGWYFESVTADPKDPDTVWVMNTSAWRSTDGGRTFTAIKGAPGGDDYHIAWINPQNPRKMILGSDQGAVVSVDGAHTWSSWYNQPTGQFYHAATDTRFPYWIYGAQQDSGAMAVPSRTIHTGINARYQRPIDAGGESGTIAPDPLHPGVVFSSTGVEESLETGWARSMDPTLGLNERWRSNWTMPIAVSPTDLRVLYTSHQKVLRSSDGGASWQVISPDLSRENPGIPTNLDRATAGDVDQGRTDRGVVYWLAPSPIRKRLVWAGTDDGLVWLTRDDGGTWLNVTPAALTAWSKVGIIDASHFDPSVAYIAVDRHRLDDNRPYIYRTGDSGKTWQLITSGIPTDQFVNVVREDPTRPGLLYAGTDRGVFVSFDDGSLWQPLQLNLPAASIRDFAFGGDDLVVCTHGRAFWILDDLTLLRQVKPGTEQALYRPETACLFQRARGYGTFDEGTPLPPEEPQGENRPWGAILDYFVSAPGGQAELTISDSTDGLIRHISSSEVPQRPNRRTLDIPTYWIKPAPRLEAAPGAHRYVWDLRYRDASGPLVPPGKYVLTLTVNGHSYSQPLLVTRDPRVPATDADLRAQFDFEKLVQAEIERMRRSESSASGAARDSLSQVADGFHSVLRDVESAQAGPSRGCRRTFAALEARAAALVNAHNQGK